MRRATKRVQQISQRLPLEREERATRLNIAVFMNVRCYSYLPNEPFNVIFFKSPRYFPPFALPQSGRHYRHCHSRQTGSP
jgi:hypothetical protein